MQQDVKKRMQIKKLGGLEVQVTEQKALNGCKGATVSKAMSSSTKEEVTKALVHKKSNKHRAYDIYETK